MARFGLNKTLILASLIAMGTLSGLCYAEPETKADPPTLLANLSPETPMTSETSDTAQSDDPKAKAVALLLQSFNGNTDFAALSQALQPSAQGPEKLTDKDPLPNKLANDSGNVEK